MNFIAFDSDWKGRAEGEMTNFQEHLKHAARMIILVIVSAATLYFTMTILLTHGKSIFGEYTVTVFFVVIFALIAAIVYLGTLLSAFYSPTSKTLAQHKWDSDDGKKFVTRVECANVASTSSLTLDTISIPFLRLTVNDYATGKCIKRVLIGNKGAKFLGKFNNGFWFYTEDFLLHGFAGLVCLDRENGEVRMRLRRKAFRLIGLNSGRQGELIGRTKDGEEVTLKLAELVV